MKKNNKIKKTRLAGLFMATVIISTSILVLMPSTTACGVTDPTLILRVDDEISGFSAIVTTNNGINRLLKPPLPDLSQINPQGSLCCSHCIYNFPNPCTPGQTRCKECDVNYGGHADTCGCLWTCNANGNGWDFTRECTFAICKNPYSCQD